MVATGDKSRRLTERSEDAPSSELSSEKPSSEGMNITIAGLPVETPSESTDRFSGMLWGSPGSGKTTLACTAPGKKLLINFDPEGQRAVANRDDVVVVDFSGEPDSVVMKFRTEDPIGLDKFLTENPDIETVIFDSLTTYGDKAMVHGVKVAASTPKGKGSTLEEPGYAGYGNKHTWVHLCVMNLLRVTKKHGRHMIFIAHENKPVTDDKGVVLYISLLLGSSLNEQLPVKISEIWNVSDTGRERRIAVRNCRWRKPMKSRMFITSGDPEFVWDFDADKLEGEGIAEWFERWKENGGKKIGLPE